MTDAYEIVHFRGKRMDRMTAQALSRMEDRLGYELTVVQGSYNTGVSASAGTHDGGGAVDLIANDWERKVRVGREIGFAMWYRRSNEGPWNPHVHGILIGNERASRGAKNQVAAFFAGRNGLANNAPDTFWRPARIMPYKYMVDKTIGISLHSLRVDFLNAIDGKRNAPRFRGRVVQRRLNKLVDAGLRVDGVISMKTVLAWRKWENKIGVAGRPGVPDRESLRRLLRWTIYFVKK